MASLEILLGAGTLAVAIVLAWVIVASRGRNRRNDAVTGAAARQSYEHPDPYEQIRRDLKKKLR